MIEPKLTPEAFQGVTELFKEALRIAIARSEIDRTCLSCIHFDEPTEICGKYNAKPCARVIVESCPAWASNDPF